MFKLHAELNFCFQPGLVADVFNPTLFVRSLNLVRLQNSVNNLSCMSLGCNCYFSPQVCQWGGPSRRQFEPFQLVATSPPVAPCLFIAPIPLVCHAIIEDVDWAIGHHLSRSQSMKTKVLRIWTWPQEV